MKKGIVTATITIIHFFLIFACFSPVELSAASYYEGKVVTIVVGHAPGGGFDRMARLLAKHLPKYIPGKPSIVVKNMLGAATLVAANYVYQAKPDGLIIGGLARSLGISQIMKDSAVRYDVTKYSWIGSASSEPTALFIRANLPYKTFQEFAQAKRKYFFGTAGAGGATHIMPLLLKNDLGLDIELVVYPGSTGEIILALERGEVDGQYSSYSGYIPYIKRGLVRPLCRGRASNPEIERLPVLEDLVNGKKAKAIMQLYSSVEQIARPYLAPPGTPENIMNILREAFKKVERDPELMAEVEKNQMEFNYIPGPEALKTVKAYMNLPQDIVDEFIRYGSL